MKLDDLKKLCDEAKDDTTSDERTALIGLKLLQHVPQFIAVAEAARKVFEYGDLTPQYGNGVLYKALAALEGE